MFSAKEAKERTKSKSDVLNGLHQMAMQSIYIGIELRCNAGWNTYTSGTSYTIGSDGIDILNRQKEELEQLGYSVELERRYDEQGNDTKQFHLKVCW